MKRRSCSMVLEYLTIGLQQPRRDRRNCGRTDRGERGARRLRVRQRHRSHLRATLLWRRREHDRHRNRRAVARHHAAARACEPMRRHRQIRRLRVVLLRVAGIAVVFVLAIEVLARWNVRREQQGRAYLGDRLFADVVGMSGDPLVSSPVCKARRAIGITVSRRCSHCGQCSHARRAC